MWVVCPSHARAAILVNDCNLSVSSYVEQEVLNNKHYEKKLMSDYKY